MHIAPGVQTLPRAELAQLLTQLRGSDGRVVEFPAGIRTASAFFDAVTKTCPLNPPLQRVIDSWDALSDSMFGGLGDVDEPFAVIVWGDPETLAEADPNASGIALDILSRLPQELADPEITAGCPKDLAIFLGRSAP